MPQNLTILIRRSEYEHEFEAGPNHSDEIRSEKTLCQRFGPSLHFTAYLTPFGDDVLIEENPAQEKERIPHSGHVILVHGVTPAEDVEITFNLIGFGPLDRRPGEKPAVNMRQKYAIRKAKRERAVGQAGSDSHLEPIIPYDPNDTERMYG